jgi:D-arabinose 1-dehydrogenase-like Zn-dependent alcohol dehydrogenase
VIQVHATGVCRSDWHGWMGHDADIVLPHVPGHEFAGVLTQVGEGVRDWRVGDRVTVPFVCACGTCAPCQAGDHQVCLNQYQPGFTGWGSYAELTAITNADLNLVAVPDSMDLTVAAGLGCRFSTAYRAVTAQGQLRAGGWLAVHGCGGVGLAAVMIAKALGARVVAVDVSAPALAAATALGADAGIQLGDDCDPVAQLRELTNGGADVSIDAFGSAHSCTNSILGLRPRGRHVQVGLLPAGLTGVPMATVLGRELELVGSHGMSARAFVPMLADIAAGRLQPALLIEQEITLDQAPAALTAMSSAVGTGGTTIIRPLVP